MSSAPSSSAARSPTSRPPTRFVRWASSGQTSIPLHSQSSTKAELAYSGLNSRVLPKTTPSRSPTMASIQRGEHHQPESQIFAYLIAPIYSHAYLYTVDLPPMTANATANLVVDSILSHASTPFPATIKQSDPQRLKFETEALVLTPYPTLSQRIKIRLVCPASKCYFWNSRSSQHSHSQRRRLLYSQRALEIFS